MPYSSGATLVAKLYVVSLAAALLFACIPVSAQQSDGRVEVMVCPDPSQSSLRITTPSSDSVVNQARVTIEGEVEFISQIDLFIDDAYNSTIALGHSATAFRTSVTLSPGTHTLRLEASDSCSNTSHTSQAVMTYEPQTEPSTGADSDTSIITPGAPPVVTGVPINNPAFGLFEAALPRPITPSTLIAPRHVTPSSNTDTGLLFGDEVADVVFRTLSLVAGAALVAVSPIAASAGVALARMGSIVTSGTSPSPSAPVHRRYYLLAKLLGAVLLGVPFIV